MFFLKRILNSYVENKESFKYKGKLLIIKENHREDSLNDLKKIFSEIIIRDAREISYSEIFSPNTNFLYEGKNKNLSWLKKFLIKTNSKRVKKFIASLRFINLILPKEDNSNVVFLVSSSHVGSVLEYHFAGVDVITIDFKSLSISSRCILDILEKHQMRINNKKNIYIFNLLSPSLIRIIKQFNPNSNIFLRFHDVLEKKELEKHKGYILQLYREGIIAGSNSYCKDNAFKLGIKYLPNLVDVDKLKREFSGNKIRYRFSFLAIENCRRRRVIRDIKEKIFSINPLWEESFFSFKQGKNLDMMVSYKEYLKILSASEIIIDLSRISPQEGLSFRTPECLVLNKKVITDRDLRSFEFYHKSRFFIIGVDSFDDFENFILMPFLPISDNELKKLDVSKFYEFIQWRIG